MLLKTRYTLINFLKVFIIVSICFLLLFFFIEVIENITDVVKHGGNFTIFTALYHLPSIFTEISPVLTFLSGMFLLGEMIKYGEVRILEISGIQPIKILLVLFVCGLIVSTISFEVENFVAPVFLKRLNITSETQKIINFSTPRYFLYSERFTSPDTFEKIQVSEITPDGGIITISAEGARYLEGNMWIFTRGKIWSFNRSGGLESSEKFESRTLNIALEPKLIIDTSRNIEEFSYTELRELMRKMENLNILSVPIKSSFHERFAYPLLNLFLLFLLFPFFYIRYKISKVFVIGVAVLISFLCYGIYSLGLTLAKAGKVPIFLGVWLVHILIVAGVGLYFFMLLRKAKSDII